MLNKIASHSKYISIIVFITILWLCLSDDNFMKMILDKSTTVFISLIPLAVSGFSGYGLSRLNVFDKLDDIPERDAALINKQVSNFRSAFESIFQFSLIGAVIVFILGLIASSHPFLQALSIEINIKIILGFIFSFIVSVLALLLMAMKNILNNISELRNKVITLTQIEKKRKALLTKMYEQAEKNPFNEMDFHLKKYNQTIKK